MLNFCSILDEGLDVKILDGSVGEEIVGDLDIFGFGFSGELIIEVFFEHAIDESEHAVCAEQLIFADVA